MPGWSRNLTLRLIPLAIVITALAGLVYAAVQQDLRSGADDPQVQMAEDTAARLNAGAPPQTVLQAQRVDMATSLAPYIIVFDGSGHPLAATVQLDGATPLPPPGVFDSTRHNGRDRFTWQPRPGVRSATIIVPYRDGFILTGRSLRLVEEREGNLLKLVLAAWAITLIATAGAAIVIGRMGNES